MVQILRVNPVGSDIEIINRPPRFNHIPVL